MAKSVKFILSNCLGYPMKLISYKILLLNCLLYSFSFVSAGPTVLVFGGKTGWVGQKIVKVLQEQGFHSVGAESRLEDRTALAHEIATLKPVCVINAAGLTGRPNVDWCEDHKQETIRANILGALNLADVTYMNNIHMINIGSGCIYEYDKAHPMYSSIGFIETDAPNFHGSFYSSSKLMLDKLFLNYPNVLNLRLRMPVSDDLHPRNFVTKITKYAKVVNIPNSMSILSDLLPLIPKMIKRKLMGTYNFVNPGTLSHNQILDLYKKYVDPEFTYVNFTLEEQSKILKAGRSNCQLDASKLLAEFPEVLPAEESIVKVFEAMSRG